MTTGIKALGGTDLDSIFVAGSGGAATGFKVGGSDLNARFAPYSSGSQASATGLVTGGQDLAQRFQKIGGVVPASVSVSPDGSFLFYSTAASAGTASQLFTASPSNGVGPFTYSFARTGGSGFTSSNPAANQLRLQYSYARNALFDITENWRVTMTDTGNSGATSTHDFTFEASGDNGH